MTAATAKEQRGFESEVRQLLDLVINSLYSNREIFLRELVSNASDAADKLRFLALSDDSLYEGDADLAVDIDFDEKAGTVTVRDNGIGMSREEVIANLGTIAKSGTREFFGALSGDARKDSQLIGQFGVGFYAAFIVADRVTVITRKAGEPAAHGVRWESDGKGEYSIETVERAQRGTEIVLHLKEDAKEFANGWRLRDISKRYSDHISIPVRMPKGGDEEGSEVVNQATAMWTRSKNELTDEEYREFYKHVSHDFGDPLRWVHSKVEGKLEYTTLFYLPAQAPFDLWDREAKHGVKLYVQRVFIMDDAEELLPRYLRFVRGIIDTSDLPLNVSREILQKNKALETIRAASVKKVLGLIEELAGSEDYPKFWQAFGRVLKEGVVEDFANKERIAKLLRFASTHDEQGEQPPLVGLDDYIGRMGDDQDAIYYIVSDSLATARNSPQLEGFRDRGIEVLLMHDPIDEWLVGHLTEYGGKPLKSVLQADLEPVAGADAEKAGEQADNGVLARIRSALGERVADVRASHRLTASPACLVSGGEQMSANLERMLRAAGQDVPESKRILEINLGHPMLRVLDTIEDGERFEHWATLLHEQSILAEGGRLDDPAGFVRRMNEVVLELAGQPG
ncbi:MAG: molecular chaperone HtpG [Gammaproteobacteria bacterium]|nr:molecular chaperone HtpG [Gammaproteobacteria bacterium]